MKRGLIGAVHIARGRVRDARQVSHWQVALPNQVASISGQVLIPPPAFRALRHHGVVNKVNVAVRIGVDEIEAGNMLEGDRRLPFFEIARGAHGQPLLNLPDFVDAGVAHRVGTVVRLHHRAVNRAIARFVHRPGKPAPQQYFDRDVELLQL